MTVVPTLTFSRSHSTHRPDDEAAGPKTTTPWPDWWVLGSPDLTSHRYRRWTLAIGRPVKRAQNSNQKNRNQRRTTHKNFESDLAGESRMWPGRHPVSFAMHSLSPVGLTRPIKGMRLFPQNSTFPRNLRTLAIAMFDRLIGWTYLAQPDSGSAKQRATVFSTTSQHQASVRGETPNRSATIELIIIFINK